MLAARERGLGTAWTTIHLMFDGDKKAAELLGIPRRRVHAGRPVPDRLHDRHRLQAGQAAAARRRSSTGSSGSAESSSSTAPSSGARRASSAPRTASPTGSTGARTVCARSRRWPTCVVIVDVLRFTTRRVSAAVEAGCDGVPVPVGRRRRGRVRRSDAARCSPAVREHGGPSLSPTDLLDARAAARGSCCRRRTDPRSRSPRASTARATCSPGACATRRRPRAAARAARRRRRHDRASSPPASGGTARPGRCDRPSRTCSAPARSSPRSIPPRRSRSRAARPRRPPRARRSSPRDQARGHPPEHGRRARARGARLGRRRRHLGRARRHRARRGAARRRLRRLELTRRRPTSLVRREHVGTDLAPSCSRRTGGGSCVELDATPARTSTRLRGRASYSTRRRPLGVTLGPAFGSSTTNSVRCPGKTCSLISTGRPASRW